MSQVRRTSRKTAPRKKVKSKTRSSIPWGLLFIVLVSGILLGGFASGYFFNVGPFGKGLKNYDWKVTTQKKIGKKDEEDKPVRTEKSFDFYGVLEGTKDRVLPDDFSVQQSETDRAKYYYIMQIATLSSESAADALRAKLALKGFETIVQEKNGKYRLKMGPYKDRRSLKNARNKVKNAGYGLNPIGIQYKKK